MLPTTSWARKIAVEKQKDLETWINTTTRGSLLAKEVIGASEGSDLCPYMDRQSSRKRSPQASPAMLCPPQSCAVLVTVPGLKTF